VNITKDNPAWDGWPVYSPDGKYIAYRKQLIPGYESDKFNIALYNRQTRESNILTDNFDNWADDFKWNEDSKSIYFIGEVTGNQPVFSLDIHTKAIKAISGDKAIFSFDTDRKGYMYYTANSVGKPSEMYRMKLADKKVTPLTSFNQDLENTVDIRPADTMWVAGAGLSQSTWLHRVRSGLYAGDFGRLGWQTLRGFDESNRCPIETFLRRFNTNGCHGLVVRRIHDELVSG